MKLITVLFTIFLLSYNQKAFSQTSCMQNFQDNLTNYPLCRIILDNSTYVCNNSGECYYVDLYVFQIPYVQNGVIIGYINHNTCLQVRQASQLTLPVTNSSKSQKVCAHSYIDIDSLALVEDIPLIGTPFDLYYSSDRFRPNFVYSPKNLGLGGWEPSILHHYDVMNKVIYFGSGGQRPIPSQTSNDNLVVAAEEGHELYVFDSSGKHLQTKNALTNNLKYSFNYDASGKLSSIVDQFGKQTLIQRLNSSQVKIISSYHQETLLSLDTNNLLVSTLNPNNESYQITYNSSSYLDSFAKPMGQKSIVNYDSNGFVTKDLGAGGDFVSLLRSYEKSSKTQTITSSTAMGRKTIYKTTATTLGADRSIEEVVGEVINQITQDQGNNSSSSSDGTVFQSTLYIVGSPDIFKVRNIFEA